MWTSTRIIDGIHIIIIIHGYIVGARRLMIGTYIYPCGSIRIARAGGGFARGVPKTVSIISTVLQRGYPSVIQSFQVQSNYKTITHTRLKRFENFFCTVEDISWTRRKCTLRARNYYNDYDDNNNDNTSSGFRGDRRTPRFTSRHFA